MFKRIFAFLVLAPALLGTQYCAQTGCGGELQPPCTGETIYISTFDGNQIPTTVVNTDSTKSPEDLVVGPDGKINACDSDNNDRSSNRSEHPHGGNGLQFFPDLDDSVQWGSLPERARGPKLQHPWRPVLQHARWSLHAHGGVEDTGESTKSHPFGRSHSSQRVHSRPDR